MGCVFPSSRALNRLQRRYDSPAMWWLIPIVVLGAVLLVMGIFVFLGRFRGGRYLRPIMPVLLRAPLLGKALQKASKAALERENPALASAMRKLERAGVQRDPQRAARALDQLTAEERRAYLGAVTEHRGGPQPTNRAQRRAARKQQR
jgi:hypothetical protein